jgi:hypothetical protein
MIEDLTQQSARIAQVAQYRFLFSGQHFEGTCAYFLSPNDSGVNPPRDGELRMAKAAAAKKAPAKKAAATKAPAKKAPAKKAAAKKKG